MRLSLKKIFEHLSYKIVLAERNAERMIRPLFSFMRYGTTDMFYHVYIDTITACNRRCYYCPNSVYERGLIRNIRKMEVDTFHKIIDELAELKWVGEIAPNFYGEPLLDDRLTNFVRYIKDKLPATRVHLNTNGDFLTVDLYKELVSSGVDAIGITHHPGGKPAFLEQVMKYRKENGHDNVPLYFYKLKFMYNRAFMNLGKGLKDRNCAENALHKIGIHWNGDIIFCCNDYLVSEKLGNINDKKLIDIWKSTRYREIRKDIKRGLFKLDVCKRCTYHKVR